MPRVRRQSLPPALLAHLLDRIKSRQVSVEELGLLADWLATEPEVPCGKWFKSFAGIVVCGEGELVRTFLQVGQAPMGQELK